MNPFEQGVRSVFLPQEEQKNPYSNQTNEGRLFNIGGILANDARLGYNSFAGRQAPENCTPDELVRYVISNLH